MDIKPESENLENQKSLDIYELNFKDYLNRLHKYISINMVISILYIIVIFTDKEITVPIFEIKVRGESAIALLNIIYIALGGMATYVATNATDIGELLAIKRPSTFRALTLSPGLGTV